MIRKLAIGALALAVVMVIAASASASGGKPETFTAVTHDTVVIPDHVNPCTGGLSLVTAEYNGVFHVTAFPDGHYQMHSNMEGWAVDDPYDPALPDVVVHFADADVRNSTSNTFTLSILNNTRASEGPSYYFRLHITVVDTDVIVDRWEEVCR